MPLLTESRAHIKALIGAEFAADGIVLLDDRLNASLGSDGVHYCGVSPIGEAEQRGQVGTWTGQIMIQMYHSFDANIDAYQTVDPAIIENWAERLRHVVKGNASVGTEDCWYFRLTEFVYPPDPTGNISRFHASALVFGNNDSIF